jgi:hypothetical protein
MKSFRDKNSFRDKVPIRPAGHGRIGQNGTAAGSGAANQTALGPSGPLNASASHQEGLPLVTFASMSIGLNREPASRDLAGAGSSLCMAAKTCG